MTEDDKEERMCELCKEHIFEGSVNTNQYNLCEGSRCDDASELLEEELELERIDKREKTIKTLLDE